MSRVKSASSMSSSSRVVSGFFKVAVNLETLKLFSAEGVSGQGGPFEAVSDVAQISDPSKVNRNGVEADEEA